MSERFVEILRKMRSFPIQKNIWKSLKQCRYHSVSRFRTVPFRLPERKIFFEGMLPEGFTRRCVTEWMHVNEDDYLSILAGLGCECLGVVKIIEGENPPILPDYRKLTSEEVRNLAKKGVTEAAQLVTKSYLSLTGVSGKAGFYYDEKENPWYLPIGDAPSTHIVKQSHIRLEGIVTNE